MCRSLACAALYTGERRGPLTLGETDGSLMAVDVSCESAVEYSARRESQSPTHLASLAAYPPSPPPAGYSTRHHQHPVPLPPAASPPPEDAREDEGYIYDDDDFVDGIFEDEGEVRHLPTSPPTSPHISPHSSPHLPTPPPTSPHISPHLFLRSSGVVPIQPWWLGASAPPPTAEPTTARARAR